MFDENRTATGKLERTCARDTSLSADPNWALFSFVAPFDARSQICESERRIVDLCRARQQRFRAAVRPAHLTQHVLGEARAPEEAHCLEPRDRAILVLICQHEKLADQSRIQLDLLASHPLLLCMQRTAREGVEASLNSSLKGKRSA